MSEKDTSTAHKITGKKPQSSGSERATHNGYGRRTKRTTFADTFRDADQVNPPESEHQEKVVKTSIWIPRHIHQDMRIAAVRTTTTFSALIERAGRAALQQDVLGGAVDNAGGETVKVSVALPESLRDDLKEKAILRSVTISSLILAGVPTVLNNQDH